MSARCVLLLWILLVLAAATKVPVKVKPTVLGTRAFQIESVETNCDHDFVEYFHRVPNNEWLHTFRVVKLATSFTINIVMRAAKSQRIMYQIKDMDGCQFLRNQLMNKILAKAYNMMIVNHTFFSCPIHPNVYFLKNLSQAMMEPAVHPLGSYQMSMRVKMPQSRAPFIVEILWKYHVSRGH